MNDEFLPRYRARFRKVIDYIDLHLDGELGLEQLSGVAALSSCHFHRQFSALLGLGVARYVQLLRMKRATHQLAFRQRMRLVDIALAGGYSGPEAFARALRRLVSQSPREFRRQPDWDALQLALQPLSEARSRHMQQAFKLGNVRVVDQPEVRVAMLPHRGDPRQLGDSIRRFIQWRSQNGLPPPGSATFNIFHDDPQDCEPARFRLDLCAATDRDIAPNQAGVVAGTIPAGRCAVLRLTGPDEQLDAAARFLYGTWLPQSGEEPRDFPLYLQRLTFFPEVPEAQAVMDLFLPLK